MTAGWHTYVTLRSTVRPHAVRHAVDDMARHCGALDIECHAPHVGTMVYLGPWEDDHPDNCPRCTAAVLDQEE